MAADKKCHVCSCSEDNACGPEGCWWFNDEAEAGAADLGQLPPVCSSCVFFLMNMARGPKERFDQVAAALGVDTHFRDVILVWRDLAGGGPPGAEPSRLILPGDE